MIGSVDGHRADVVNALTPVREQPADLPFIDNSKTELLIYTSKSREDQSKFVQNLISSDSEFVNAWWDTFTCIACMSVDRQFGPELQFTLKN